MQIQSRLSKTFLGRVTLATVLAGALGSGIGRSGAANEALAEDTTCLVLCNVQVHPSNQSEFTCSPGGEWLCRAAFPRLMEGWF